MAAADRTFKIRPALAGQTLAAGLRRLIPNASWADAKRLVASRFVHVNGNLCVDEARRLAANDVVKIFAHARPPPPSAASVRVRHVDADLIVIEKPAGVTTLRHAEERDWDARRKDRQPTLDELVQRVVPTAPRPVAAPSIAQPPPMRGRHPLTRGKPAPARRAAAVPIKQDQPIVIEPPRVRPVHRLDRDTSGLMLFALSFRAEQSLVAAFKAHAIERSYRAVVVGRLEGERTFDSHLVRDRGDGLRGSARGVKRPADAQHAVTHVRAAEHLGDAFTIVECRLQTGRTHQIRIHLAEAGHPLCGDRVYTRPTPTAPPIADTSAAPRQALHSATLVFTHPTSGDKLAFESAWPGDLAEWLRVLRKQYA